MQPNIKQPAKNYLRLPWAKIAMLGAVIQGLQLISFALIGVLGWGALYLVLAFQGSDGYFIAAHALGGGLAFVLLRRWGVDYPLGVAIVAQLLLLGLFMALAKGIVPDGLVQAAGEGLIIPFFAFTGVVVYVALSYIATRPRYARDMLIAIGAVALGWVAYSVAYRPL